MHSQKTVIMADDDADDCFMATEAFRETGWEAKFSCVNDGSELLEHLAECSSSDGQLPNLILIDLNMPRRSGFDTLRQIRADPGFKNIPAIILTTSSSGEVAAKVKSMADGFITKPATFNGWIEIMHSIAKRWLG